MVLTVYGLVQNERWYKPILTRDFLTKSQNITGELTFEIACGRKKKRLPRISVYGAT